MGSVLRIVQTLAPGAQVRLVLSGVAEVERLLRPWSSSGATLQRRDQRVHAVTTVEALVRAAGRTLERETSADIERVLRAAVSAFEGPTPDVQLPGGASLFGDRTQVMGIVNVTPDSFADGGLLYPQGHPEAAVEHARRLTAEGADILDVGGESTRPGAEPVADGEELSRVLPVVKALAGERVPVSIDTRKPAVARAAIEAGAVIVNDVSGAAEDELLEIVAEAEVGYVLMHTRGTPSDMSSHTDYDDVVSEVYEFLANGLDRCEAAGVDRSRILVDPGIGFAKTADQSLALLAALRQFRGLGRPVVVGASRKSFLSKIEGSEEPEDRLEGSLAAAVSAAVSGAAVVRVHDVSPTVRATRAATAITRAGEPEPPRA